MAEQFNEFDDPMICLATAHPAKFPEAVAQATGRDDLAKHPTLEALRNAPTRCKVIANDATAVRDFIEAHAG